MHTMTPFSHCPAVPAAQSAPVTFDGLAGGCARLLEWAGHAIHTVYVVNTGGWRSQVLSILSKLPAMAATAIQVVTGPKVTPLTDDQRQQVASVLPRLERLASILDDGVKLPWVGWRVGIEPLIGLLPYGDFFTGGVSLYVLVEAVRMGVPRALLIRIIGRSAADLLLGLVPVIGDVLDFFFHAHRANIRDLHQWLQAALEQPTATAHAFPRLALQPALGPV
ncbi:MAG: hypothetical protein ACI9MR_003876 [Myxococcota bacterium]|jgi:hypothetical protein